MMKIAYLQKFSLQDYPGIISCIIFLHGCNFRCGFCHNPELVEEKEINLISEEEVLDFLSSRKGKLEGIVITGGEPLINYNISDFLKKIKNLGFKIKVDTNGSNPNLLKELIDNKLIDYVALDIKTSKNKYKDVVGIDIVDRIEESIKILINSKINYEFRTTVVPGIVDLEDIKKIKLWLGEISKEKLKNYYLQQFRAEKVLDNKFKYIKPHDKNELEKMKQILDDYCEKVEVRV